MNGTTKVDGEVTIIPSSWSVAYCQTQGSLRCFLLPFPSLLRFKNGDFDFREGDALMTHQVIPLTSQSWHAVC